MVTSHQVAAYNTRDRKAKDWDRMRDYNIELEEFLAQCISLFAQHDIAPPDPPARVAAVLQEKFLNAVKGE